MILVIDRELNLFSHTKGRVKQQLSGSNQREIYFLTAMNPASDYLELLVEKFHKATRKHQRQRPFQKEKTPTPNLKLLMLRSTYATFLLQFRDYSKRGLDAAKHLCWNFSAKIIKGSVKAVSM